MVMKLNEEPIDVQTKDRRAYPSTVRDKPILDYTFIIHFIFLSITRSLFYSSLLISLSLLSSIRFFPALLGIKKREEIRVRERVFEPRPYRSRHFHLHCFVLNLQRIKIAFLFSWPLLLPLLSPVYS